MQPQVIGILAAVITAGVGYHYLTKDKEEETTTTTQVTGGGVVVPEENQDADAVSCEDDMGCPADRSHCESGECVEATSKFTTKAGSLYPAYGSSDLKKPSERLNLKGSEMCAKACLDDPDCVAFTHWEERYNEENPKTDGEEPTWEEHDRCWFWSGPQGEDTTLTPSAAVGPAHEGASIDENPEAHNSVARTYIKEGMSDYVPADENTQEAETDSSMHMTDTGNPFYHPASNPTGSGFVISDKSTKV
tara:strand:+ start:1974 stop:2717 length:744 start_codon:yes stop_codon:yes gene_type:complete